MPHIVMTLFIVAAMLVLVSLLQPLANRMTVPLTVLLAGLGIGLGSLSAFAGYFADDGLFGEAMRGLARLEIGSEAILTIFLPILLFETGLTMEVRRMVDDIAPILLLAIVAVLVCSLVVGWALWAASTMSLIACLLLGAIVATTDPVAVVGIFRDVGAPQRLSILVEGESLFNDAAAIALFILLLEMLTTHHRSTWAGGFWLLFKGFIGGGLVGWLGARLMILLLKPLRNLPLAEITLTLALAYLAFLIAEHVLAVSGVVAVVTAALVVGSTGRTRITPQTWDGLVKVWSQLGFWSSTLIFIFASMLVPRFLEDVSLVDAGLLAVLVAAAFAARAAVLYGLMPALSAVGLAERVDGSYRLVILWGGLRGAVTLALALAITENPLVPPEAQRFVAVLATGFVLFTLLVNATTLRPMMRLLRLDRLGPVEEALRNRTIALALSTVADRIDTIARRHRIAPEVKEDILAAYRYRLIQADKDDWRPLTRQQQLDLGLIALANREEELYLTNFYDLSISRRTIVGLLAKAGRLRDGAKTGGKDGYLQAGLDSLQFRRAFHLANLVQRRLGLDFWLAAKLADRFESLLITRMVLEELSGFIGTKLMPVLGEGTCASLRAVLTARLESCDEAMEALRLQYPDYARTLEERFLRQAALRTEEAEYRNLLAESVISQEIFNDLQHRLEAELAAIAGRPPLDLGLKTEELVRRFPMFEMLDNAALREVCALLNPRFAYPGERLMTVGERGDFMYFISSGAIDVVTRDGHRFRLGRGSVVGELALLTGRRRTATVTAIAYCQLLILNGRDFRRFVKAHPEIRAQIRRVGEERLRALGESPLSDLRSQTVH